jgi:hypothetical protein
MSTGVTAVAVMAVTLLALDVEHMGVGITTAPWP